MGGEKQVAQDVQTGFHRITPAQAGKSPGSASGWPRRRDHPRVGGEKILLHLAVHGCLGSPPRGRGKVLLLRIVRIAVRITPAWAGKSTIGQKFPQSEWDHPRAGGEKEMELPYHESAWGSPPRGRGKGEQKLLLFQPRRITPAWAGKRLQKLSFGLSARDHPRVGGEKQNGQPGNDSDSGSPPHRRGKACPCTPQAGYSRITPAWAGKSPS